MPGSNNKIEIPHSEEIMEDWFKLYDSLRPIVIAVSNAMGTLSEKWRKLDLNKTKWQQICKAVWKSDIKGQEQPRKIKSAMDIIAFYQGRLGLNAGFTALTAANDLTNL